jgi:hypothetical protein
MSLSADLLRSCERLFLRAEGSLERPGTREAWHEASSREGARSPVTWVIVPRYPLTAFLFEPVRGLEDIQLIERPLPRRRWFDGLLRSLEVYALPWVKGSLFFDETWRTQLARIRPEDTVLYFAIENRKDLQILRKFVRSPHQHVWLWNPICTYRGNRLGRSWYLHWLRRSGVQAYTFNPPDAQDGQVRLLKQVYRHVPATEPTAPGGDPPRFDVFFVGIDKGRLADLRHLQAAFEHAGLTTHFHVVADKRRRYSEEDLAWLTRAWLPYEETLRFVRQSRAVLELLQAERCGPTIRSLEAAFLGRKLITDNEALRETDLYHPSRIFILGRDPMSGLKQFLESPLVAVDPAVLRAHDIVHWVRQFRAGHGRDPDLPAA